MRGTRTATAAVLAAAMAMFGSPVAAQAPGGGEGDPAPNPWLGAADRVNIAHGGGLDEEPENTLRAFRTAAARGADVIEIDVQITADGHLVAMHDSTVDDTTDGHGCVVSHTLAEIQQLDAAHWHVPGQGTVRNLDPSSYPYRGVATGAVPPPEGATPDDFTVPALADVFTALPDALYVLEIKPLEVETRNGVRHDCPAELAAIPEEQRPDIVRALADLIDEHDMADQVIVASFIDEMLHEFNAVAPDVPTSFPLGEALGLYVAFVNGQPLQNPHGHVALQAPLQYASIALTEELVDAARDHGIAVHVWTINDPAEMHQLLDWGVDGIITDQPETLARVLAEREGSDDGEDDEEPVPPQPGWQSPFLCTVEFQGLGQPIVDNQEKRGTPVYPETATGQPDLTRHPIGWSEGCQVEPVVEYRYRTTSGALRTLPAGTTELPADVAWLDVSGFVGADQMDLGGATQVPYVIRYERGTLPENRFLYSIAMLAPWEEVVAGGVEPGSEEASEALWNRRLLFSFGGGVGIGHSQGELSTGAGTLDEAMRLGHAVIYTSGTRTSTHYNLLLGGRTAVEAKALFVERHGEPLYTVGIGGSGGGIQQYIYAQNHPDLLDALIPQYAYPDMSTQTIHIGDCELLEHYFDVIDAGNPRWADWDNRRIVEGLNSIEGFTSDWQQRMGSTGSSECIEGWRGATPLAMNPTFGFSPGMEDVIPRYLGEILTNGYPEDFPDLGRLLRTHEDPSQWVQWTHFDDAAEAYGVDPATGHALVPWDNVGVQYGLRAVANGQITPEEFLALNARVGSWNERDEAELESCALASAIGGSELGLIGAAIGMCQGNDPDWHSARNATSTTDPDEVAPRRSADVDAIRNAFESGLVFTGRLPREVPILDTRHYLEHQLDMHNAHQSFAIRERLRRAQGHVDNHAIWFLDARPAEDPAATSRLITHAFRVMDEWVLAARQVGDVGDARPASAADACWATDGTLIGQGPDVWSGAVELVTTGAGDWAGSAPAEVDGVPVGACAAAFPLHSTSRIVAGGPITGDVYKCHLMPVSEAIDRGLYGRWTPSPEERERLEAIFPNGVCDYSKPSVGDPSLPAYVARFKESTCGVLRHFVDVVGYDDVAHMIRSGVLGYAWLAEQGAAQPVASPHANDDEGCEFVITWDDEAQRQRALAAAEAWGLHVDAMHHYGGLILPAIIYVLWVHSRGAAGT